MDGYRTAQVCLNGHTITSSLESSREMSARFCSLCGQATISECPNCNARIRGYYHVDGVFGFDSYTPPRYCHECGSAFQWTKGKIAAAKDLADELNLPEAERLDLKAAIDDLSSDTPRTELAVHRFKRIIGKVGQGAADSIRAIVVDIASEAVKKALLP